METQTKSTGPTDVNLSCLWRAAALITGDVEAASWVVTEVARDYPRPERVRESTLVGDTIERCATLRDEGASPAPLPFGERVASDLARLRGALDERTFALWVFTDVMGVEEPVLANAVGESLEHVAEKRALTADAVRETLGREAGGVALELRDAIDAFDARPGLEGAADAIRRDKRRRIRNAMIAFAIFALAVALLVYVKIDLQKAAEKEKRSLPSLQQQFSNPAPDAVGEGTDETEP